MWPKDNRYRLWWIDDLDNVHEVDGRLLQMVLLAKRLLLEGKAWFVDITDKRYNRSVYRTNHL